MGGILTFLRFKSRSFSEVYRGKNDLSSTDHFSFSHEVEISWVPLNLPLTSRFSGSTMFNWKTDLMEKSIHSGGESSHKWDHFSRENKWDSVFLFTHIFSDWKIWRFFFVFCWWLESVQSVGETAFLDMFGFPKVFKGMLSHQYETQATHPEIFMRPFRSGQDVCAQMHQAWHFGFPGTVSWIRWKPPEKSESSSTRSRQFQKIPIDVGNAPPQKKKQTPKQKNDSDETCHHLT